MTVTSFEYIVFVFGVSLLYFVIPRKARAAWLLAASLAFYVLWSIPNAVLLVASSLGTYFLGMLCEARPGVEALEKANGRRKGALVAGILLLLAELFIFKYLNFVGKELNLALKALGSRHSFRQVSLVMPVGVSFFVFQSIGYLVDVYRGKVKAERNIINFMLFITFFPKIIQGPIERSDGFLKQIDELEARGRLDYRRVTSGLVLALWGFFMKLVIADRIAILADRVFSRYYLYGTVELALGAVAYAIQIYCDFAGYSAIAVGVGRIYGFELIQNFNCPYFSVSTRDFWRRWHISLSAWFRDYVYIPLGGSRCSKWRKRLNTMIVMLVSGIWHGAGWSFIAWGLIHGLYQVAGDIVAPRLDAFRKRIHARTDTASHAFGSMCVTFILIDLAWVFFRASSFAMAVDYLRRMFTRFNPWALFDGSLLSLGLNATELNVLVFALAILIVVDVLQYTRKLNLDQLLERERTWFKWGVVILLITMVWVFGEYGPGFSSASFIYQNF